MNLEDIRNEVISVVSDSSFSTEYITAIVNETLQKVCGRVIIPGLKMLTTATLDIGVSSVSLSSDFGGRVVRVLNSSGEVVEVLTSLELMMDRFGAMEEVGELEAVCQEGNVLWFAERVSAPETVTILYLKRPGELVAGSDIPSELPDFLHRDLLVYGTAVVLFNQIEDGLDGAKTNTQVYMGLFEQGISRLCDWIGRNKRHYISSVWSV